MGQKYLVQGDIIDQAYPIEVGGNKPPVCSSIVFAEYRFQGFRIGGAEVSEKHANFIINRGDASATDIEELIEHVRQTVIEQHGVELVHEVRIVGEVAA